MSLKSSGLVLWRDSVLAAVGLSFVGIFGVVVGIAFLVSAKSAVHEIEGLLSIGFGVLIIGVADIVWYASRIYKLGRKHLALEKTVPTAENFYKP